MSTDPVKTEAEVIANWLINNVTFLPGSVEHPEEGLLEE